MAITGTGTQADPFKPATWDEFLSCTTSDGAATVTGYTGGSAYPRIPDVLGGAPVRSIAGGAFTGTSVRNVYIPEGVTTIE